jgi:hypothetical protein
MQQAAAGCSRQSVSYLFSLYRIRYFSRSLPLIIFISTSMLSFIGITIDCDDQFAISVILFRLAGHSQQFHDRIK